MPTFVNKGKYELAAVELDNCFYGETKFKNATLICRGVGPTFIAPDCTVENIKLVTEGKAKEVASKIPNLEARAEFDLFNLIIEIAEGCGFKPEDLG